MIFILLAATVFSLHFLTVDLARLLAISGLIIVALPDLPEGILGPQAPSTFSISKLLFFFCLVL